MTYAFVIMQPITKIIRGGEGHGSTEVCAFSFYSSGLVLSDVDIGTSVAAGEQAIIGSETATTTATDAVIAAATTTATPVIDPEAAAAFTDQVDLFGDPTIRTLFLVFGGVVVVLAGLAVLSQKVDAAIESVVEDFENVLRSDPDLRSKWVNDIEPQLKVYDNEVEKALLRKQKLFQIMEEMQETEPTLMKQINAKMEALNNSNRLNY